MPQCSRGCRKPVKARGLCGNCYQKFYIGTLDFDEFPRRTKGTRLCSLGDCDRKHYARGMCHAHYFRWRRGARGEELERPIRRGHANLPAPSIPASGPKEAPRIAPRHNPYGLLKGRGLPDWAREMAS